MNINNSESKARAMGSSASSQIHHNSPLLLLGIMFLFAVLILLAIFRWLRPVFPGLAIVQFNIPGIPSGINTSGGRVGVMQRAIEEGVHTKGVGQATLEACPKMIYSEKLIDEFRSPVSEQIMRSCAICLDDYQESVDVLRLLPICGHMFHAACIDQWLELHATCPVCRHSLEHTNYSSTNRRNDRTAAYTLSAVPPIINPQIELETLDMMVPR